MYLNTIKDEFKKSKKRVGRGIGSTLGKTAGRGHKGQHARAGGYKKVGFEGGQMPLQRRLPKVGFKSHLKKITAQLTLSELNAVDAQIVDLDALKTLGVVPRSTKKVRIIDSGEIGKSVVVKGLTVTSNAAAKIVSSGGKVE